MIDWSTIKGLLFDKDGTLIDFLATWMPACCQLADELARTYATADVADRMLLESGYDRVADKLSPASILAGGTNQELIGIWRDVLGDRAPSDIDEIVLTTFAQHATGEVVPTAEMQPLMSTLRDRGLILGIATNDDTESALWTAEFLGVAGMMAFVTGADAGHGGKPGPGMGLAFCRAAGIAPEHAAMVGDSAADANMALAAGFGAAIGVCTGAAPAHELADHFDVVIDSVADLPDLLSGRPAAS
ncbi:MAG: HAD family hydrolase [Rhodospirillales bacterium]|nr:HAD family hydrolase [Rhodospirillales bacterium]